MTSRDAVLSVLEHMDEQEPLSAAARALAEAGVPVFPCVPGAKRPLTEHGFHEATTDAAVVVAWWRQHPAANIGMPTGHPSAIVVADVDVHGPVSGYAAFERAIHAGLADGWQLTVTTPSGGMHAYYPAPYSMSQSCWQAARVAIDFRGDGGYVLLPPSRTIIDGETVPYRVVTRGSVPGRVLDADRLRDFLDPRPVRVPTTDAGSQRPTDTGRLAAWVAGRQEGERNRGLFWAACRLAENGVPATDALDALTVAAGQVGLGEREISTTVRSAYRTVGVASRQHRNRRASKGAEGEWFRSGEACRSDASWPGLS
ncbi:bifunctional DNA primase/polymerase [Humibacter ginsenosidimutans]|uniref:DNA primase n=1 Tax=Humibacter ginsenosidimutans TaxID=2599293 RepID=A0A5B8M1I5_9MICO|nr:bifunctional DNA primase/polymerase [Humibacter ginsenosidimutans]QDZ14193.1 DNA primase [Humibacter ginsenosidimutans]